MNHSLRATTATRLFRENVPEQLIMEQTGHRSTAVHSYKRASADQKRKVSRALQGVFCPTESNDDQVATTGTPTVSTLSNIMSNSMFNMSNSEIHIRMK